MRAGQKRSTISVRLNADEERLLRRIARRRKTTLSEVIREAVGSFAEEEERRPVRPFEQMADLIGSVSGLPPDLSERGGERFAEIVRKKVARRK